MKIIILGGFLGSGKTTVLLGMIDRVLRFGETDPSKVVIIENEIGEIGVDDKLLRSKGYDVRGMYSGCICCSMSDDIVVTVKEIAAGLSPEFIFIESSGVGYPHNIKDVIKEKLGFDSVVCAVADASRWERLLFALEDMLREQLKKSDFVLVNKTDLSDAESLAQIDGSVREMAEGAEVFHISASASDFGGALERVLGI